MKVVKEVDVCDSCGESILRYNNDNSCCSCGGHVCTGCTTKVWGVVFCNKCLTSIGYSYGDVRRLRNNEEQVEYNQRVKLNLYMGAYREKRIHMLKQKINGRIE